MLSVGEALDAILHDAAGVDAERIELEQAFSRVLAEDLVAKTTQPPFDSSAMDGYAVRWRDAVPGARLALIGEARAGDQTSLSVGNGQAARIFTGGVIPRGADHVVIQEDVAVDGGAIVIQRREPVAGNVRRTGLDFAAGDRVLARGRRLTGIDLALAAAANITTVSVHRRPRIAFFDNGDELADPGAGLKPGELIGSNRFAFAPLIAQWGGVPAYVGRARDDKRDVARRFEEAHGCDVIVAIGGASVGAYDFVRPAFAECGGELVFSKVSVKPGKPTWCGRLGSARVLGLPGNPASAIVCALLFLKPLVRALCGEPARGLEFAVRELAAPLPANGARESYLRAYTDGNGRVAAFGEQDSSLLRPFARSTCLIRRPANAAAALAGAHVECLDLATH